MIRSQIDRSNIARSVSALFFACAFAAATHLVLFLAPKSIAAEETRLDLDQIFGLTEDQLTRYIPALAQSNQVAGWKGFKNASFHFNATKKFNQLEIQLTRPLSEEDTLKALKSTFKIDFAGSKVLRPPVGPRFEGVSAKTKSVTLPAIDMQTQPQTFDRVVITSTIGYNE